MKTLDPSDDIPVIDADLIAELTANQAADRISPAIAARIKHRVGNRISDLVGMAFTDRLRRKDVSVTHQCSKKKARVSRAWLAT